MPFSNDAKYHINHPHPPKKKKVSDYKYDLIIIGIVMFFQDKVSRDFPLLTTMKLMIGEITGDIIINIIKREIINHKVSNKTVLDMIIKEIVQTCTVIKILLQRHLTNEISILI